MRVSKVFCDLLSGVEKRDHKPDGAGEVERLTALRNQTGNWESCLCDSNANSSSCFALHWHRAAVLREVPGVLDRVFGSSLFSLYSIHK